MHAHLDQAVMQSHPMEWSDVASVPSGRHKGGRTAAESNMAVQDRDGLVIRA